MRVLQNKHVLTALCVSPILAIIMYIALDKFLAAPAQRAEHGNAYPLVAKSNCRYASGRCTLVNGDIEILLTVHELSDTLVRLDVNANYPIGKLLLAVVSSENHEELLPVTETSSDSAPTQNSQQSNVQWQTTVKKPESVVPLRIAVNIATSHFFAETDTNFFHRDNMPFEPWR